MKERKQETKQVHPELGLQAQDIVVEFVEQSFPDFIYIERMEQYDPNDLNGVDFVCGVFDGDKVYKFAVDATFANDERMKTKMKKVAANPVVCLRDQMGNSTGEELPRVLLYERSTALWLDSAHRAQRAGVKLIEAMPPNEIENQKRRFFETVIEQARNLGRTNKRYNELMKPVGEIFEIKLAKLNERN